MIVTSAKTVWQLLSIIIKSIRPIGGSKPVVGGAISAMLVLIETGILADLMMETRHWLIAVCLGSHSVPRLHFMKGSDSTCYRS